MHHQLYLETLGDLDNVGYVGLSTIQCVHHQLVSRFFASLEAVYVGLLERHTWAKASHA